LLASSINLSLRCFFGKIDGVEVVILQGRTHPYEGYTLDKCAMPVRVLHLLGVKRLVVSNAAGGLDPTFRVGDLMAFSDHVNLMGFVGNSPLAGKSDPQFGQKFFPMNMVYTPKWRKAFRRAACELGLTECVREGVYIMLGGPNFETPAELRMLRVCGVDAVGKLLRIPE